MRVLVTGGRNYGDEAAVFRALNALRDTAPPDTLTIIQGGATGADEIARRWCCLWCVPYINVPADWQRHGRAAGPLRNQHMLDLGPDLVLAFPGGAGTADMVRRARAAHVEVRELT